MNDLTDLMYEASDGDPNRALDPAAMVREGRRRLYRRRGILAVSGVVAAVLVIVGGATWFPRTTDDGAPRPHEGRPPVAAQPTASYRADGRVELSRAEVERRCTIAWRNLYGPDIRPVELRDNDRGPWFEGDEVEIANWLEVADWDKVEYGGWDEPLYGDCVIPQAGLVDIAGTIELPLPASDDEAGVRVACGRFLGWDFSGWQIITADSGDGRLAALLRSTDGYMANCQLDGRAFTPSGHVDLGGLGSDLENTLEIPSVEIATEARLRADSDIGLDDYEIHPSWTLGCQREPPGDWVADCLGWGWVSGPEPAARIVITDVTGAEHEIPVVDRWYVFAGTVINHADVPEGGCPPPPNVCDDNPGELHFTVYAADGTILAEYDEDEDLPLIS